MSQEYRDTIDVNASLKVLDLKLWLYQKTMNYLNFFFLLCFDLMVYFQTPHLILNKTHIDQSEGQRWKDTALLLEMEVIL